MEKVIGIENLNNFIITNEKYLACSLQEIKGLAIEFPGFDGNSCLSGNYKNSELNNDYAKELAKQGVFLVYVFTGPWNWMRDVSVKTVDDIIDAVIEKYQLSESVKIVYTGGSMGGLGALSYNVYGKHKAVGVAVSCPVCDLFAVSKVSPYFAASVFFACAHYDCDYESAVRSLSPLYFVDKFPQSKYFILGCTADEVIPWKENGECLFKKMKALNLEVDMTEIVGMGHCRHTKESINDFIAFILSCFR